MGPESGVGPTPPPERRHIHGARLPGELVRGEKPGKRPDPAREPGVFRRTVRGYLVATEAVGAPRARAGRWAQQTRDYLIGRPLSSEAIESERMSVFKALPI